MVIITSYIIEMLERETKKEQGFFPGSGELELCKYVGGSTSTHNVCVLHK